MVSVMTDSRAAVSLVKNADIHVITGLLKVYLRELPQALFTDTLYPKLVEGFGEYQLSAVHHDCWIMFMLTLYRYIKTTEQWTIVQQYSDWYTGR